MVSTGVFAMTKLNAPRRLLFPPALVARDGVSVRSQAQPVVGFCTRLEG